jgi:hypothetical protein
MKTNPNPTYMNQNDKVYNYMDDENNMINNINAYNQAYINYIICTESSGNLFKTESITCPHNITKNSGKILHDDTNKIFKNDGSFHVDGRNHMVAGTPSKPNMSLSDLKLRINNNADTLGTDISDMTINSTNLTGTADIIHQYNTVRDKRAQIDTQIQSLYSIQDSYSYMEGQNVDATVYAGILWTILATTSVYYIFTKL